VPDRGERARRPPLLAVLAELYASVEERDVENVLRICNVEARRIPREVREEAMAVAQTPYGGFRAPLRLLVFWRSARVLDMQRRADEATREQLELEFPPRESRERRLWRLARPGTFTPRRRREDGRDADRVDAEDTD
jgi:hypothetical protein